MPGLTMIGDLIASGKEFGIFDFYLPFVIMFTIFWALLTKIKLFGDTSGDEKKAAKLAKGVNLIISLSASLYIMAFSPIGFSFTSFFSQLFGGAFMVILTIIAFISVLYVAAAVAKGDDPFEKGKGKEFIIGKLKWEHLGMFAVLAAIVFVSGVYLSTSGTALFPGLVLPGFEVPSFPEIVLPTIGLTGPDMAILFMVVLTGLIIWWVTREGKA